MRKCPYCDFNSHERGALPEQAYLQALLTDLEQDVALVEGRTVETVFIGGGTPSLLSADFYQQLFRGLRQRLALADSAEITLEANPGTLEAGRFEGFREAGINRLSIGVQSFNNQHLQALGRIHDSQAAVAAAHQARQAGFDNFNLDIMHALPGQSREQALDDLQRAIELAPTHLSWYELTIEPNTVFYRSPPTQPDSDTMADTESAGFALLADHGYHRYEISAFAQPGRECRHNLNYWQYGDYLAIGAGAHGKLTNVTDDTVHRYQKTRLPEHYLADPGGARRQWTRVEKDERLFEALLNGLRLPGGIALTQLTATSGQAPERWLPRLQPLVARKLLRVENERLACTETGLRHLNTLLEQIADQL
ncbi:coproporphyrinogen oxidase [Alcanivorax hongdengensis A-11-3]|uniref:Heme chaperone HemW n=1 Tax=Alcanivorax hongdengensis A-11-3 TaxID=1177179 RepID=L0WC61_9GAMM|nr:coproporphyrinogen oxidase [Alcanivorax hongdengensis A-11-3]